MQTIKSKSSKRLIVDCKVSGKTASFLIDTGASIALIDKNQAKKFDLKSTRRYNGTIVGAGGTIDNPKICNTVVCFENKPMTQFLIVDIENIVDSVERETGIKILGIISLPQMKINGIQIDANDDLIMVE